ncbi:MAG: T9SS type A sorting domain-containing protein [Bacteroidia bacterium]|nr:T9SS type A sorting domain-containing protein [Bacteroidia bacterium]
MNFKQICLFFSLSIQMLFAQTVLEADGPGNTYELINSVLAPSYNVIEVPDCKHSSFGRHIDEVFDTELNKFVFRFQIHTAQDDDRCIKFDRQRNEIKTYDKSPDELLGIREEWVVYKWKFKLDSAFQPSSSFTHLHQLKAVGGSEASMPLITLTARKASPNRLELRYAEALSQRTLDQTPIAPMLGIWLDVKEVVYYDEVGLGKYEVLIQAHSNGDTLFHYSNQAIRTWKTGADFIRPKWGIYRSLNDSSNLRDEEVWFADFSIEETTAVTSNAIPYLPAEDFYFYPNPARESLYISDYALEKFTSLSIYTLDGRRIFEHQLSSKNVALPVLGAGIYIVRFTSVHAQSQPIKLMLQNR